MLNLFQSLVFIALLFQVQVSSCFPKIKLLGPTFKNIPQARECNPEKNDYLYSGFRLDRQISLKGVWLNHETHLLLCKEGKIIQDISVPLQNGFSSESIPWASDICNLSGSSCFRLARSKNNVLRHLFIFLPNSFVGGIFEVEEGVSIATSGSVNGSLTLGANKQETPRSNYNPSTSLVSSDLFDQWLEVKHTGELTYHIPLLHSPEIKTKEHAANSKDIGIWAPKVSPFEDYNFDSPSKKKVQKAIDTILGQTASIMKANGDKIQTALIASEKKGYTTRAFNKIFGNYVQACVLKKYKENGSMMPFVLLSHLIPKIQLHKMIESFEALIRSVTKENENI